MGPLGRALALAICLLSVTAASASAQGVSKTFTVNTTADINDPSPDGVCNSAPPGAVICSLREAIREANATAQPDTIILPANTYNLTLSGGAENAAASGDLDINSPVTIDGGGARSTIVNQSAADRVFEVLTTFGQVEIEGLSATGASPDTGNGAGLRNTGPATRIVDAAVRGNSGKSAAAPGGGIENTASGNLTVLRSLVNGNDAGAGQPGGGIFNSGVLTVINSTINGNTAATGSGIQDTGGAAVNTTVQFTTITQNNSTNPGGAALQHGAASTMNVRDSIVAINTGTGENCAGNPIATGGHNIESGTSCDFSDTKNGDRQNVDPGLGPFGYSSASDQTETYPLLLGSPARDAGNTTTCPANDQRAQPRPSGPSCDSGAVEEQPVPPPPPPPKPVQLLLDPPTANRTPGDDNTVTASVRNDDGSPAANQSIRYAVSGPNDTAGEVTTDASGVARISWDGVHEGTDTLAAFVDANKNFTSDQGEPTGSASVIWALPAPEQGKTANIEPVSGRVRITIKQNNSGKVSSAGASQLLTEARQVPLASVVDTRRGRVRMTTEANSAGDVQKGEFYGGVFTTRQSATSSRPITELRMTEALACQSSSRGKLVAARSRRRHLWGNGRGRFRTRGRYSTATVRGTIWIQKDSCNTTTTAVRQGVVIVKDLVKRKNVRVKAGKRYTARKSRRRR